MNTETREERIKRLMREREEGTLSEKPTPAQIEESPVEPAQEHDWEEEARIVSAKNRERIKKNAELAAAQAKAATQLAEKGAKSAIKSLHAFKGKAEAKLEEQKEKRRLKREEQEAIKGEGVEALATKGSRESSTGSNSGQPQTRMKFWMLCSIPVTLSIILTGIWLLKARDTVEATKGSSTEQPRTERAAEPIQVLTPVAAALPRLEEPPQSLPPLPQQPSVEEDFVLEAPTTVAQKGPETKRPVMRSERVPKAKTVDKSAEPAKREWQKDAAKKLEDYQF